MEYPIGTPVCGTDYENGHITLSRISKMGIDTSNLVVVGLFERKGYDYVIAFPERNKNTHDGHGKHGIYSKEQRCRYVNAEEIMLFENFD